MESTMKISPRSCLTTLFLTVMLSATTPLQAGTSQATETDRLLQGEQIYRHGILPSGKPLLGVVTKDTDFAGSAFSCISCHMRSGLGSVEGGVVTTSTTGRSLYQPRSFSPPPMSGMGGAKSGNPPAPPPPRPAYTDATLAKVLLNGVDPAGRVLSDAMPRYYLSEQDTATLIAYLKSLSAEISPGISNKTLHLATVITEEVPTERVTAMIGPLQSYITEWNRLANLFETRKNSSTARLYARNNKNAQYKRIALARWVLKGKPSTWRSQLEEYYRSQPVFALVGGITTGDWSVMHAFSETNRIPSLFPHTDLPVLNDSDWYTLYLSKGLYQEGAAAAKFVSARLPEEDAREIVQVVRDSPRGRALAQGFDAARQESGQRQGVTVLLKGDEAVAENRDVQQLVAKRPAVIVVWDGAEALNGLGALLKSGSRPELLLLSASYLGKEVRAVPDEFRDIAHITFPYRLPADEEAHDRLNHSPGMDKLQTAELRQTAKKSIALVSVLNQALFAMKDDVFRDYFLDNIAMIKDLDVPLYERISFGPGQRYASKGCYIVTLTRGASPQLVKKSDWVSH
ncbi:MAG: c-type cytochrome [Geobacter sp.]|nr:c-type cytochrome [Geobacter sp.]